MELVKVIIPVYRAELPELEEKLLSNNLSVLSNYPVVFVCPDSLDISSMTASLDKRLNISVERFRDNYFRSIDGYNELLLSSEFYRRFLDSEYILICQTDAFVFRDDLTYWCNKDYDYIGGPWIGSPENKWVNAINGVFQKLKLMKKRSRWHLFHVGNGGFSLRKTAAAYKIAEEHRALIESYLGESPKNTFAQEDLFWSFKSKELNSDFFIPEYKEALNFAMDRRPEKAVKLNGRHFPFGAHGLNKKNIRKFWMPVIQSRLSVPVAKKTLIFRYHRIGDALLILPLIYDLANKYEKDCFTVVTNHLLKPLFELMPPNVACIPMAAKRSSGIFRGISYILRRELLFWKMRLTTGKYDRIIMLQFDTFEKRLYKILPSKLKHNTIIGNYLNFNIKEIIVKKRNDISVVRLHQKALETAGYFGVSGDFDPSCLKNTDISALAKPLNINFTKKVIAIAPFSRGKSKIYPLDKMAEIVAYFAGRPDRYQVLVLGGGIREEKIAGEWLKKGYKIISLINRVSFSDEVLLVAHSDVVLSMDSVNLHLASLLNTPVVSIWGATTPQCGYYPAKEPQERAIVKGIACQPCSLFGEIPCTNLEPYECLNIEPEIVIDKVKEILWED